jgi:phage terminase large subunit
VLKGGAGSGKSYNLAQDYIVKLSDPKYKGANLLCVRKADVNNRSSTYAELSGAVYRIFGKHADSIWRIYKSPLSMHCLYTGNQIEFRGLADDKQREHVKSITFPNGKLVWIWCEEASEFEEQDIEILDDRLRGHLDNQSLFYQMTFSFNPISASHWLKRRFYDAPSPRVFACHSTYLNNRFCDADYHKRMMDRKEIDPEGYAVYGLGQWGEVGGQIFTNYYVAEFDRGEHRFDAMAIGQDFGFNHANAILLLGVKDGEVYVCSEIYVHEKYELEVIELAKEAELPSHIHMWCDSAQPGTIKAWRANGFRAEGVEKEKGSVRAQISWLKGRKIYIHPSCTNTIKEIQTWKWSRNKRTGRYEDDPVEEFNDAMAALRYGIEGWRKSRLYSEAIGTNKPVRG